MKGMSLHKRRKAAKRITIPSAPESVSTVASIEMLGATENSELETIVFFITEGESPIFLPWR